MYQCHAAWLWARCPRQRELERADRFMSRGWHVKCNSAAGTDREDREKGYSLHVSVLAVTVGVGSPEHRNAVSLGARIGLSACPRPFCVCTQPNQMSDDTSTFPQGGWELDTGFLAASCSRIRRSHCCRWRTLAISIATLRILSNCWRRMGFSSGSSRIRSQQPTMIES